MFSVNVKTPFDVFNPLPVIKPAAVIVLFVEYILYSIVSFKFSCHEHKMIYCRTSRNYNKTTSWTCNLCKTSYENKIWSFYCKLCDYDICLKCSKEFISEDL